MAANTTWAEGEVLGDKHREAHNDLGYIDSGTGSPEGVLTAPVGSLYLRTDGGTSTTVYVKESGTGNTGWVALGVAVTDHGALTGLSDDDHPQYLTEAEGDAAYADIAEPIAAAHISDTGDAHDASAISILDTAADFTATDVEGALAELQSDAETHAAAADPHAGYVLESLIDVVGDLIVGASPDTVARLPKGTTGQVLTTDSGETLDLKWESRPFSITFTMSNNGSAIPTGIFPVWRAPFACTVTAVYAQVDTGTTTVVNAGTGIASAEDFCSSDITIDPADAWEAGTVNQNTAITAGETVSVEVKTAGTATVVTIQIDLTRP